VVIWINHLKIGRIQEYQIAAAHQAWPHDGTAPKRIKAKARPVLPINLFIFTSRFGNILGYNKIEN